MLNLLTNAVKFTPDGGHVAVGGPTRRRRPRVTVTDNGIGIAPEDRERIFESFQQGRRGPPQEEGTGLGLTLSRRIVELFGGRLWLDSGARGRQHLRLHRPARAVRRAADRPHRADEAHLPVVVLVDDDRARST